MVVHRHDRAGSDEDSTEDVLGGASLVHGQEVGLPEKLANLVLELGEGARPGVAVVGLHHGGELPVTHGVHAAVGEHVQVDVAVLQQKRVVASFGNRLEPSLDGHQIQLLHDADLVHFEGQGLAGEQFDVGHGLGVVGVGCWVVSGRGRRVHADFRSLVPVRARRFKGVVADCPNKPPRPPTRGQSAAGSVPLIDTWHPRNRSRSVGSCLLGWRIGA